jgi:branched-chain amino acid transport system substrate-binding protein
MGKRGLVSRRQAIGVLGFAAVSGPAVLRAQARLQGSEVRLGAAVPISGHGADTGKREAIAIQAAIDEINSAGGIGGVPVKMYLEDTASTPQEAVIAVRKLAGDHKVLAIIGPHYSSEAETTFPLGNQLKLVQIAVASSKPGVSAANRPYGFRNTLSEDKVAGAVVEKFKKRYNVRKAAIITDMKDAVARSLGMDVYPAAFKAQGIEIVTGTSPVTFQTDDAQFTAQITRLKSFNPDGVGLGALGPDALNIITEARRQGMTQPFFGLTPMMEGNLPEKGGKALNGTFAGGVWHHTVESPESQRLIQAYRKVQSRMYTGPFTAVPDYYPANSWDAVFMLKEAMEKNAVTNAPSDLAADREKIMKYLTTLNNFKGGAASYGFDAVGDGLKPVHVFEIADGTWREVK